MKNKIAFPIVVILLATLLVTFVYLKVYSLSRSNSSLGEHGKGDVIEKSTNSPVGLYEQVERNVISDNKFSDKGKSISLDCTVKQDFVEKSDEYYNKYIDLMTFARDQEFNQFKSIIINLVDKELLSPRAAMLEEIEYLERYLINNINVSKGEDDMSRFISYNVKYGEISSLLENRDFDSVLEWIKQNPEYIASDFISYFETEKKILSIKNRLLNDYSTYPETLKEYILNESIFYKNTFPDKALNNIELRTSFFRHKPIHKSEDAYYINENGSLRYLIDLAYKEKSVSAIVQILEVTKRNPLLFSSLESRLANKMLYNENEKDDFKFEVASLINPILLTFGDNSKRQLLGEVSSNLSEKQISTLQSLGVVFQYEQADNYYKNLVTDYPLYENELFYLTDEISLTKNDVGNPFACEQ